MKFDIIKFIKGLVVRDDSLTPTELELIPEGTPLTKTTLKAVQTGDRVLHLPDVDGTLVELDAVQTLTNKNIDADNNTISNLEVDNFKNGVIVEDLMDTLHSYTHDEIPTALAVVEYVEDEVDTLNLRIDNEVDTLNQRIDDEVDTLDLRIDNEVDTLDLRIDGVEGKIDDHIADPTGAHISSAISYSNPNHPEQPNL